MAVSIHNDDSNTMIFFIRAGLAPHRNKNDWYKGPVMASDGDTMVLNYYHIYKLWYFTSKNTMVNCQKLHDITTAVYCEYDRVRKTHIKHIIIDSEQTDGKTHAVPQ